MPGESLRWQPELAPEGPISAVVSRQSGRVIVIVRAWRSGGARGVQRCRLIGTHVLMLAEGAARTPQRHNLKRATQRWIEIEISGHADHAGEEPDAALDGRLEIPPEFLVKVSEIITPGATVLVTDDLVTPSTSGPRLEVINSEPPPN
jgi:hypothetical protein